MFNDYFKIGCILGTHGIKGDMRVFPTTDDPSRFSRLNEVEVRLNEEAKVYEIENARLHKQFVILKLRGVDSANDASPLKGGLCVIPREQAIQLSENEYYIPDLIGMTVYETDTEELGVLADVIQTGANDVYVIKKEGQKDLLIPAIKSCITDVNVNAGIMTVRLPAGLR